MKLKVLKTYLPSYLTNKGTGNILDKLSIHSKANVFMNHFRESKEFELWGRLLICTLTMFCSWQEKPPVITKQERYQRHYLVYEMPNQLLWIQKMSFLGHVSRVDLKWFPWDKWVREICGRRKSRQSQSPVWDVEKNETILMCLHQETKC